MKVITVEEFEKNFEEILEDVDTNKVHYRVNTDQGALMVVPVDNFRILSEAYEEWIHEPKPPTAANSDEW